MKEPNNLQVLLDAVQRGGGRGSSRPSGGRERADSQRTLRFCLSQKCFPVGDQEKMEVRARCATALTGPGAAAPSTFKENNKKRAAWLFILMIYFNENLCSPLPDWVGKTAGATFSHDGYQRWRAECVITALCVCVRVWAAHMCVFYNSMMVCFAPLFARAHWFEREWTFEPLNRLKFNIEYTMHSQVSTAWFHEWCNHVT